MTTGIKEKPNAKPRYCALVPGAPTRHTSHIEHRLATRRNWFFVISNRLAVFSSSSLGRCLCRRHSPRHSTSRKTIQSASGFDLNGMAMFGPRPRQIQWIFNVAFNRFNNNNRQHFYSLYLSLSPSLAPHLLGSSSHRNGNHVGIFLVIFFSNLYSILPIQFFAVTASHLAHFSNEPMRMNRIMINECV